MNYRNANPDDLAMWLDVARDVGGIMRVPDMDTNQSFLEYAKRKLEQENAIIAYDKEADECAGFIGFSIHNNSITWLGVKEKYRNRGVGSELIKSVLSLLDHNKRITVNTYPQDYLPGRPARSLYSKHGFVETVSVQFAVDGLEMVEFSIIPQDHSRMKT